jgi:hypothetical protein
MFGYRFNGTELLHDSGSLVVCLIVCHGLEYVLALRYNRPVIVLTLYETLVPVSTHKHMYSHSHIHAIAFKALAYYNLMPTVALDGSRGISFHL